LKRRYIERKSKKVKRNFNSIRAQKKNMMCKERKKKLFTGKKKKKMNRRDEGKNGHYALAKPG
jgi:hypothetical protein